MLHCHHWVQKSSSGFLCWIADRKFSADIFRQTLSCKLFHLHCIKYPVCRETDSYTMDLQPLNVQKVLIALGKKKIQTCRRNSDGLGSGISGAHPACKGHLSPLFPIYFCRYLSLTWGCYCLHKFKNIFLSAGSEASPLAPHNFLLAL